MREEQKKRWKRYVESYNKDSSKQMHLLSCTHVVNRIIDTLCDDKEELQIAYNIAMGEINNLRCKLGYSKKGLICPSSLKTSKLSEDKDA